MILDVSVILACHNEGLILKKTLLGLKRVLNAAAKRSLRTEVVLVCDNATAETMSFVTQAETLLSPYSLQILATQFGDAAGARNAGIACARGKYVTILDGDDFYSENWIFECFRFCENNPNKKLILHPEIMFVFERSYYWRRNVSVGTPDCDVRQLVYHCYWSALSFSAIETYQSVPYETVDRKSVYGYEDWHWNCEVVAKGYIHKALQGTSHFVRLKTGGSRNVFQMAENCVLKKSSLFDDVKIFALSEEEISLVAKETKEVYVHEEPNDIGYLSKTYIKKSIFLFFKFLAFAFLWPLFKFLPESWRLIIRKLTMKLKAFIGIEIRNEHGRLSRFPPDWVVDEANRISLIEPYLALDEKILQNTYLVKATSPVQTPGIIYSLLLNQIQKQSFTNMVVFGEEFSGETEDIILKMAEEPNSLLIFLNPKKSLMLALEKVSAQVLPLYADFSLYSVQLVQCWVRLLVQFNFRELVVVDSAFGLFLIAEFGKFVTQVVKPRICLSHAIVSSFFTKDKITNREFAVNLLNATRYVKTISLEERTDASSLRNILGDDVNYNILKEDSDKSIGVPAIV